MNATTSTTVWNTLSTVTTSGVQTTTVNPPLPTNMLTNSDFETGSFSSWTYGSTDSPDWPYSITRDVDPNGVQSYVLSVRENAYLGFVQITNTPPFNVIAGQQYKVGFIAKNSHYGASASFNSMMAFGVNTYSDGFNIAQWGSTGVVLTGGWVQFEGTFTPTADQAGDAYFWFDLFRDQTSPVQWTFDNFYAMADVS